MSHTLAQAHDPVLPSDRRGRVRQPIRSLAYVELDEGNGGIILNISEGGLSVQAVTSLMDDVLPGVRFQLSESDGWIAASARIVWTGQSRKLAGLEFVDLADESRIKIKEWLVRENSPADASVAAEVPSQGNEPTGTEHDAGQATTADALAVEIVAAHGDKAVEHLEPTVPAVENPPLATSAPVKAVKWPLDSAPISPSASLAVESEPADAVASPDSPSPASFALVTNHWAVAAILGVLAAGSLAAGWAAGQGDLGRFVQRIRPNQAPSGTSNPSPLFSPMSAARPTEIEVVGVNNQRWTIPFDGPMSGFAEVVRRPAPADAAPPAHSAALSFRTWILGPPQRAQTAVNPGATANDAPPIPAEAPGVVEPVLNSSGEIDSHGLAETPNLRSPATGPAGEIKQSELVHRVDPAYPPAARSRGVEGTVRLNVTIATDGSVRGVALLGGPPLLVEAAEKAVVQWRYTPTYLDGKPIEVQKEVDLRFHFTDPTH
jgi:TonB family protein